MTDAARQARSAALQRSIAEAIASGSGILHEPGCGVWQDTGDGCDCPLTDAILEGLIAARIVSLEQELGYDSATKRGDHTIRLDFNPMPVGVPHD